MATVVLIKAADVHEAARLTYNKIMQQRIDKMNEQVLLWQAWCRRFPWKLFSHRSEQDFRYDLRTASSIKVFPEQLAKCRVILALCEGAMLHDEENATVEVDADTMSHIEIGWGQMMHNRKMAKMQSPDIIKGEWPVPGVAAGVNAKSLIAAGDDLSGKSLFHEDKPLLTDEPEAKPEPKSLAPMMPPADTE